jgi:prolyl-tRNA editing enzyme YbaK/EbsC (Cys-tRNA(Pro) deacylase)
MMQSMDIQLGTLEFSPALTRKELLAPQVARFLEQHAGADAVGVTPINGSLSDTVAFCVAYQVKQAQAANCVVLEAKQGSERSYAAAVVLGSTRADVNGLMKRTLEVRKVSFASMEFAVEMSGMEFGAITPIGLPSAWPIFIDRRVAESGYVIIGSGLRHSKLAVKGSFLATLPNVTILDDLGLDRTLYGNA